MAIRVIGDQDINRGRSCHACQRPLAPGDQVRRAAMAPGYFEDGPDVASEVHVACDPPPRPLQARSPMESGQPA